MGDKPKHWWWNGRFGRLARRAIKIYPEGHDRYRVEAWHGGVEGKVEEYPNVEEPAALALAESLADNGGEKLADWRDMAAALR